MTVSMQFDECENDALVRYFWDAATHLFGKVSSFGARGGCSRPKIRSGIRIRAQNRAESSGYGRKLHAKSSQSLSLAGRPAGGWLAGHAIGCKSQHSCRIHIMIFKK